MIHTVIVFFFFFNDTATTEIYTLSLHDALPISRRPARIDPREESRLKNCNPLRDRKSTRLNSSHRNISYAVFCLKKKKQRTGHQDPHSASVTALSSITASSTS